MSELDGYFDTRLSYEPKRDAVWKPIVNYLQRYILEDSRVLELGAGYCSFINQVKASERHALDKSDIIRNYADKEVQTHVKNCKNLRSLPSRSFDVVFSSFLYEHLTRRELDIVMKDLRRILTKTGILITLLPNFKYVYKHYYDDYTHVQVFTHLSFADYLVSHGFEIMEVQGRFLPYSFKSRFPKSPLLTSLYLRLPFRPFAGNMLVVAKNTDKPVQGINQPHRNRSRPQPRQQESRRENLAPASILKDGRPESEMKTGGSRRPSRDQGSQRSRHRYDRSRSQGDRQQGSTRRDQSSPSSQNQNSARPPRERRRPPRNPNQSQPGNSSSPGGS